MKTLYICLSTLLLLSQTCFTHSVYSQAFSAFDEVKFLTQQTGVGSRALAMGGAFTAVSDDYSAVYWNPAGLGQIPPPAMGDIYTSFSYNGSDINAGYLNHDPTNTSNSNVVLNSMGIVLSETVKGRNIAISAGYNRVHTYNSVFGFTEFNPESSYVGALCSYITIPDNLTQNDNARIFGDLSQVCIGFSIEYTSKLYIGAAVHKWFGVHCLLRRFDEIDTRNLYTDSPDDFNSFRRYDSVRSEINGHSFILGILYRFSEQLRAGLTVETPRMLKIFREWFLTEYVNYDNAQFYINDAELYIMDYRIRTPYTIGAGLSYRFFSDGIIAVEIKYTDWKRFRFQNNYPSDIYSAVEANNDLEKTQQTVFARKIGIEYPIPHTPLTFRTGFGVVPNPDKNVFNAEGQSLRHSHDQKLFSTGVGYRLSPNFTLDITYLRRWQDVNFFHDINGAPITIKDTKRNLFASIYLRF
ncbi:OmpP1/FadL family transporter [candidate division KSB1 bacterium]